MSFNATVFCAENDGSNGTSVSNGLCYSLELLEPALAQLEELKGAVDEVTDTASGIGSGLNVFYLLFAGAAVFLMQSGFAMLCAGSIRQKNTKNILLKNLLDACGGALGFWTVGYALAYGGGDENIKRFIGNEGFFLTDFSSGGDYIGWFFQFAFAATAATIVAGTVAERCKMVAYLCYSVFLTGFVYPVVVHSVWGTSGFLSAFNGSPFQGIGAVDFAGSGVVHMTGGATALVAAIILGPRKGRFYDEDGNVLAEPVSFPPHSVALQVLGTFILWFGWYGFNPGSTLAIDSEGSGDACALCAVTTTIAAACGAVTSMFLDTLLGSASTGETLYDVGNAMNGCLGGLVAITAGCSVVTPWAAAIIGIIGGIVYVSSSALLVKLKIDDAVDAVPVHFFNGAWGVIAVGLFAEPDRQDIAYGNTSHVGFFYDTSDASLLVCQICEVAWVIGWVSVTMIPFFIILNTLGMFRVDPLEEDVGLDISHHKGAAYDLTGPSKEDVEELVARRSTSHGKVTEPAAAAASLKEVEGYEDDN